MAYIKVTTALLAAGLAIGIAPSVFSADEPKTLTGASDSMLANTCAGCHGTNGASQGPASPTIAGLSEEYFVEVMTEFASGDVPSTIMGRIAKGYSEEEINQLAKFYAGKEFVKAKQAFDPKLAEKGAKLHDKYCEKCHAEGGQSAEDDAGVLAGQWTAYTKWQLDDYVAGHREPTKKMKKQLNKMLEKKGNEGIDELLNYYASQQD